MYTKSVSKKLQKITLKNLKFVANASKLKRTKIPFAKTFEDILIKAHQMLAFSLIMSAKIDHILNTKVSKLS